VPGRRHYSTRRWLTRRAREARAGGAPPDAWPPRPGRCRRPDCINCKGASSLGASRRKRSARDDDRWSAATRCRRPAPRTEHAWQMPAPVRRLDKANRRLRRMLKRQLAPGVTRGIATLVTTDAVLTPMCVLARAIPYATGSAKVCPRRKQMSPALDRGAVVDSTLVVDSTHDTRISTIGVDLSTLSWYIRQGAQKCAHA